MCSVHACVFVSYREGIAGILSIHELHFDSDVAGRTLPVSEVQALRIDVQQVPEGAKEKQN